MSLDDFFQIKKVEEQLRKEAEEAARLAAEKERRQRAEAIRKRRKARTGAVTKPAASVSGTAALPPPVPPTAAAGTVIEELPDRYRLHSVQYRNGLYTIDWSKELLENGAAKTQDDWIAATQAEEWKLADALLYFASLRLLYQNQAHAEQRQKKLVEKLKTVFKADFEPARPYIITSSRVKYTAKGDDVVTHCFGYPEQQELQAKIVGPDGCITAHSGMDTELEALLGTGNGAEVETVGEWITGLKPYLWRLNQKPPRNEERAVLLGGDVSGRFVVVAGGYLYVQWPARGVVVYPSPAGGALSASTPSSSAGWGNPP